MRWKLGLILMMLVVAVMVVAACDGEAAPEAAAEVVAEDTMEEPAASRLATVQERGTLICASRNDVPGYGSLDASGRNVGFDIDLCRAVAAAVLGDAEAIEITFITAAERGPTIQSGEVDLLVRTVTWTTSRDAQWGNYVHTTFYDGQGFMVPKDLGVTSAYELGGASVCVTSGTTTELNMSDFFRQNNLEYNPKVFEDTDVVLDSYKEGQCDVFTNDRSQLAALRSALPNPDDHVILPETISEEPLGPVVPHGDEQWFDIVKTVVSGLIYAEAYGINSSNVAAMAAGDNVKAKRLLGTEGSFGQDTLGLSETFMQDVIGPAWATTVRSTPATSGRKGLTCRARAVETLCGQTPHARTARRAARYTRRRCASRVPPETGDKPGGCVSIPLVASWARALRRARAVPPIPRPRS